MVDRPLADGSQTVNTFVPQIDDADLPANFRENSHSFFLPSEKILEFIDADLSVIAIERFQGSLWMVGRPLPPRPLNAQGVLGRSIIPTTDTSLHLVWTKGKIFIRALPRYFLADAFYDAYLGPSRQIPGQSKAVKKLPRSPALGLLYSYIALVPTELDFALAHRHHLLPPKYEWKDWQALTRRVLEDYRNDAIYEHVSMRYWYGELRLGRLNKIYMFWDLEFLHGYSRLTASTRYDEFLAGKFAVIAAVTIYIAVLLNAMQVGLATNVLSKDSVFQKKSSAFTIFAIVSTVIAILLVLAIFVVVMLANIWRTRTSQRKQIPKYKAEPQKTANLNKNTRGPHDV